MADERTNQNAARAAEAKRTAIADREADVKRQVAEGREAMAARNAEVNYVENNGKPTPTPEEIDSAALGHHIRNKEDDGSGPERLPRTAAAPYMTRDAAANRPLDASTGSQRQAPQQQSSAGSSSAGASSSGGSKSDNDKNK